MDSLIYLSQASRELSGQELAALVERSIVRNRRLDITGYLVSSFGFYYQYLEGPKAALDELMDDITADDRHEVQWAINFGPDTQRLFAGWAMRVIDAPELSTAAEELDLESVILQLVELDIDDEHKTRVHELVQVLAARISPRH